MLSQQHNSRIELRVGMIKSLNQNQITLLVVYGLIKRYWKNKHTRQYNSTFKSRSYLLGFDKCCKGIKKIQISAVRMGVRYAPAKSSKPVYLVSRDM